MNVLLSACTHWWNAEAHYAAVLAECLRESGHRVWTLTQPGTRHEEHLRRRGLDVVTDIPVWTGNPLRWPALRARLAGFQARHGIQIVNVFRSREFPLHLWAAAATPGVRVVRTRGNARPIRGHWLNRRLHRACGGLIASAEVLRSGMIRSLKLPPSAVRTVYFPADPPLDWSEEQRREGRQRLLAELGWGPERVLLAIVGRATPEKGHARLLDALEEARRLRPQAALVICDKRYEDEAPYRAQLEAHARHRGLAAHVRWLGVREDVRQVMASVDLGVIPSLSSEFNCRVAMEFFSAGTPVVAFPTGALPEVVEHNVTGVVTADHEAHTLAGVLGVLTADEALRLTLARNARAAAHDRFSRRRFLDATLDVYAKALAAPR
jgi:glycosyltransferase involved in cell wall biosynthesis